MLLQEKFDDFLALKDYHDQYNTYFPLAVFGTLRKIPRDQGNYKNFMLTREPIKHKKAFIPHILPSGIWVNFEEGASGLFEVFFYNEEDYPYVIERVDSLEGFRPDSHYIGYHRTLLEARLLPDDYPETLFNRGIWWDNRTLEIPEKEWNKFESVPTWAYSNNATNLALEKVDNSPLLWWRK